MELLTCPNIEEYILRLSILIHIGANCSTLKTTCIKPIIETEINSISKTDDDDEYMELEFNPSTATTSYTVSSVAYDTFKTFAIKIVMNSSTTTKVPLIKDLRVIALA